MHSVVISGTGLYQPPHTITNAELVESFNRYVDLQNAQHATEIAAGTREPLQHSSVEFIEKASGIKQRYVLEKSGILDPTRMYPRLQERPDDQLADGRARRGRVPAGAAAGGKTGADIDAVLCAASNMQRAYPAMAVEIQQALGAGGYGFDMNVACSSATFAIEQAVNAVRTGSAKCVWWSTPRSPRATRPERPRLPLHLWRCVHGSDRRTRRHGHRRRRLGVLGTRLATQFSNNIRNNFGFLNRSEDSDPNARDKTFRQEGRKVFKEVVPIAPPTSKAT
jgi:beta-ketodecanoyl-[acyl-carrier-protein] synthase